jgi:murein DD-endopeptidase MepM/ murein hydrolase activator NlpD
VNQPLEDKIKVNKPSKASEIDNKNNLREKDNIFSEFLSDFIAYIRLRLRQFTLFTWAFLVVFIDIFSNIKNWSVRRMYWGRSSLYRSAFHFAIFTLTTSSLLLGLSSRINVFGDQESGSGLVLAEGVVGINDTLYQAGTAEAVAAVNPSENNWPEYEHTVKRGDTLDAIAEQYQVSKDTIKWANDLSGEGLRIGQVLTVPGLDGVLYEVEEGDTVDSIVDSSVIENANEFDIVEMNELEGPNYNLEVGQRIFIPNANIKEPVARISAQARGSYINFQDQGVDVEPGTFINPLSYCPGYRISRGVLPWHAGVDMAKRGGCWINASSDGVVTGAQWGSDGRGFYVDINHGNGFISHYYHGNGEFAVKKGQQVKAGQRIMYMGCTGNCTGTHLHFQMSYNGRIADPARYMAL